MPHAGAAHRMRSGRRAVGPVRSSPS
jgi:hypothetical protein